MADGQAAGQEPVDGEAGALDGIVVVEVASGVAAALAGRMMAGYGADVLKVEPPEGDPMRRAGPFPPGKQGPETSASFLYFNGGKSSVVLDLGDAGARAALHALARRADVLLVDAPVGDRAALGLDRESLEAVAPGLVVVSVSPYGEWGPHARYRATALTEHASGGQMSLMGDADKPPLTAYGNQAEAQTAFHVYGAALAALLLRRRTGRGSYVELSVQEQQASALEAQGPMAFNGDPLPDMFVRRSGNGLRAIWAQYECKDGYAGIFVNAPNLPSFFAAIGHPEWLERAADEEFMNGELYEHVREWCAGRTRQEVYDAAVEHGAPFSYVATPEDLLTSDVVGRTGIWREVDHPAAGAFRVPGPPVRTADLPFELRRAPLLGEHTDEVLDRLAAGAERSEAR